MQLILSVVIGKSAYTIAGSTVQGNDLDQAIRIDGIPEGGKIRVPISHVSGISSFF